MEVINKKAQMKIQQMAFMLIAVTLFFVLAGLFVFTIFFSNIKTSAKIIEQENAVLLVSKLSNSPEFSCENAFGGNRLNCIDADKAMALKENANEYSRFWGVDGIEIKRIYDGAGTECSEQNYPECGSITILSPKSGGTGVSNFAALCKKVNINDTIQDVCDLAKVIVTYNG